MIGMLESEGSLMSAENEPSQPHSASGANKKSLPHKARGLAQRYVSLRMGILANAQEGMQRNPHKRPMVVVLLAATVFTVTAYLDSVQEHIVYSWPFVLVFVVGFCYGLAARIESRGSRSLNTKISYVYVGMGFAILGMLYYRVAPDSLNSQAVFGWALGWLYGMAAIGTHLWARDKKGGMLRKSKRTA